jgi:hypothetical protein
LKFSVVMTVFYSVVMSAVRSVVMVVCYAVVIIACYGVVVTACYGVVMIACYGVVIIACYGVVITAFRSAVNIVFCDTLHALEVPLTGSLFLSKRRPPLLNRICQEYRITVWPCVPSGLGNHLYVGWETSSNWCAATSENNTSIHKMPHN